MKLERDIDVILLSLNRAYITIESLENILLQKNVNANIFVIDQNSEVDQYKVLEEFCCMYSNIILKRLEKNIGVPGGRHLGLSMGSSEITVSVDNDAIFSDPYALERICNLFIENKSIGVIGFKIVNFVNNMLDLNSWPYSKSILARSETPFLATRFVGCGHAIRRSAYVEAGGYDEDLFFYWEELDLSLRIINSGYSVTYDPSIIVRHKTDPESRVKWSDSRYYYLVRNALLIDYKYYNSIRRLVILALGYLIKAIKNNLLSQWIYALRSAWKMLPIYKVKYSKTLSSETIKYIEENDLSHRGNILKRLRTEIFVKL